jgi:hypothetical protein
VSRVVLTRIYRIQASLPKAEYTTVEPPWPPDSVLLIPIEVSYRGPPNSVICIIHGGPKPQVFGGSGTRAFGGLAGVLLVPSFR